MMRFPAHLALAVAAAGLALACSKKPAPAAPRAEVVERAAEDTGERTAAALDLALPDDWVFQFDLGSDAVQDPARAGALAALFSQDDLLATITGHACPLGPDTYNHYLSLRRAQALAVHLERAGVPAWRLKVEAMGESRPLSRNPREYSKNRRVNVALSLGVK